MKKIVAILLLSVFIISCSNNSKKDNTIKENKVVDSIVSDPVPTDNEIQAFISKFSTDSAYQMSHIQFPVMEEHPDSLGYLKKGSIEKENWKIIDIRYDSIYYYRQYSSYEQKFFVEDDTLNISHGGLNCGINFGYKFVRKNEEWILFEVYDHSN